jgi:hypothetical protein
MIPPGLAHLKIGDIIFQKTSPNLPLLITNIEKNRFILDWLGHTNYDKTSLASNVKELIRKSTEQKAHRTLWDFTYCVDGIDHTLTIVGANNSSEYIL